MLFLENGYQVPIDNPQLSVAADLEQMPFNFKDKAEDGALRLNFMRG